VIVAHADWSVDPRGRWITVARRDGSGWRVAAPSLVGDVGTTIERLSRLSGSEPTVLGLDFPIGLPRAYAALHAREPDFPAFLRALRDRPSFFAVCGDVAEISGERPFYPQHTSKGTIRAPHIAALGLRSFVEMTRLCDRKTADRPAAASLFWTLGANQVGKAALCGWRDLLLPALLRDRPARLWPFDGTLTDLVARGGVTIAETYPAEAMRQLGLPPIGSKRRQADRAALAPHLLRVMARLAAVPDKALSASVSDGFGPGQDADDPFDSLLGLLCMLNVVSGCRGEGTPRDHWIMTWEGWVLGQAAC
jgi:hypothetical protein